MRNNSMIMRLLCLMVLLIFLVGWDSSALLDSSDGKAKSIMRDVATAQDSYFFEHKAYLSCTQLECIEKLPGLKSVGVPKGVEIEVQVFSDPPRYVVKGKNNQGSGREFVIDSSKRVDLDSPPEVEDAPQS